MAYLLSTVHVDNLMYPELKKTLGQNLKKLRLEKGWKLDVVAERLTLSAAAVSKIENGITDISLSRLYAFGRLFAVPVQQILDASNAEIQTAELSDLKLRLRQREDDVVQLQTKLILLYEEGRESGNL